MTESPNPQASNNSLVEENRLIPRDLLQENFEVKDLLAFLAPFCIKKDILKNEVNDIFELFELEHIVQSEQNVSIQFRLNTYLDLQYEKFPAHKQGQQYASFLDEKKRSEKRYFDVETRQKKLLAIFDTLGLVLENELKNQVYICNLLILIDLIKNNINTIKFHPECKFYDIEVLEFLEIPSVTVNLDFESSINDEEELINNFILNPDYKNLMGAKKVYKIQSENIEKSNSKFGYVCELYAGITRLFKGRFNNAQTKPGLAFFYEIIPKEPAQTGSCAVSVRLFPFSVEATRKIIHPQYLENFENVFRSNTYVGPLSQTMFLQPDNQPQSTPVQVNGNARLKELAIRPQNPKKINHNFQMSSGINLATVGDKIKIGIFHIDFDGCTSNDTYLRKQLKQKELNLGFENFWEANKLLVTEIINEIKIKQFDIIKVIVNSTRETVRIDRGNFYKILVTLGSPKTVTTGSCFEGLEYFCAQLEEEFKKELVQLKKKGEIPKRYFPEIQFVKLLLQDFYRNSPPGTTFDEAILLLKQIRQKLRRIEDYDADDSGYIADITKISNIYAQTHTIAWGYQKDGQKCEIYSYVVDDLDEIFRLIAAAYRGARTDLLPFTLVEGQCWKYKGTEFSKTEHKFSGTGPIDHRMGDNFKQFMVTFNELLIEVATEFNFVPTLNMVDDPVDHSRIILLLRKDLMQLFNKRRLNDLQVLKVFVDRNKEKLGFHYTKVIAELTDNFPKTGCVIFEYYLSTLDENDKIFYCTNLDEILSSILDVFQQAYPNNEIFLFLNNIIDALAQMPVSPAIAESPLPAAAVSTSSSISTNLKNKPALKKGAYGAAAFALVGMGITLSVLFPWAFLLFTGVFSLFKLLPLLGIVISTFVGCFLFLKGALNQPLARSLIGSFLGLFMVCSFFISPALEFFGTLALVASFGNGMKRISKIFNTDDAENQDPIPQQINKAEFDAGQTVNAKMFKDLIANTPEHNSTTIGNNPSMKFMAFTAQVSNEKNDEQTISTSDQTFTQGPYPQSSPSHVPE